MKIVPLAGLLLLLVVAPLYAVQTTHVVPDDHATIQAAVVAAADFDTILIKAGTYAEAVVVDGRIGLTIRGKGKVILDPPGDDGIALTLQNCTDPVVSNLRMTGAVTGLKVADTEGGAFSKCRIEAVVGSAVILTGVTEATVKSFVIDGAGLHGIALGQGDPFFADDCQILKNRITDSGEAGIFVSGEANFISGNRIFGGQRGCLLDDIPEPVGNDFFANKVSHPELAGFRVFGSSNSIVACKVIGGGNGIEVVDGETHVLQQCKLVQCAFDGVFASENALGLAVTKCRVTKPLGNGVVVLGTDATVTDNRVSGAGEDGFSVEGNKGSWTGNRASGSVSDGFEVSGTGNTLTFNKAKGSQGFDLNDLAGAGMNSIDETNSFPTKGP